MKPHLVTLGALAMALTAWACPPRALAGDELAGITPAASPSPEAALEEGIEVQPRGPLHEAFAQPVEAQPRPGPVVPKQPPEPIPEQPPDQKPAGDNVQWIPGYWAWDVGRNDFLWVSGFWRVPPAGRKWVPGYWTQVDNGWQWISGLWAPASQGELDYLDQPPASLDHGPDTPPPNADSTYVPGCWVNRANRYLWRPGYWLGARPNFLWVPAHYCYTPSGYVFVDGYWDRCLEDRGLLFAPVCFRRPLWNNPDWCYRPSYCLNIPDLLPSLFIRPGCDSYYFGDYYGPGYSRLGFRPWFAYGRGHYDPLFSYYRWRHRGDPGWYSGLRSTFLGRANGTLARSPRGLVRPLAQVRGGRMRLARVGRAQVQAQARTARAYQNRALNRRRLEGSSRSLVRRAGPATARVPARSRGPASASRGARQVNPARTLARSRPAGPGPRISSPGRYAYRPYQGRNGGGGRVARAAGSRAFRPAISRGPGRASPAMGRMGRTRPYHPAPAARGRSAPRPARTPARASHGRSGPRPAHAPAGASRGGGHGGHKR